MSNFFKILKSKDEYSSVVGSAVIVKNVSGGPFEVDEEGRVLSHNSVAAVDSSCKICANGIANGKLQVIKAQKVISAKSKNKQEEKVEQPVREEPVEQPVHEELVVADIPETVASAEQDKSVQ
jgi:hypothetical protein